MTRHAISRRAVCKAGLAVATGLALTRAADAAQSVERFNAPAGTLQKLDTFGLPPQAFLGVAGMPGLTAWVGLLKISTLKPSDVVFVSAASGAVGSVVCQIAKLKGHTVIGSAGGAAKCAFLKHIGVDHVIDYKVTGDLTDALLHVAPTGIDVYFENAGGEHLEAALAAANPFARFAICGMISQYNAIGLPDGPRNIMFVMGKSLRLEGFNIANYFDLMPEFQREMSRWIHEGKITWKETIEHGIENAGSSHVWVIDPIDGTRAFISGLPVWGTLVGLTIDGDAVAGLMSQPITG